ncbi:probable sodium/potassium-transporting ATPase subunit beta-3 [Dreissena polymorpha]|uniref:Sodium/potassium-transporting ATPase subunit beta n=1 Tax=Dreissena polymorpha TaxID=45954 RepID=A0A9D4GYC9_DREPO|nr:probable sodium/potassium-transporting ATPase subunit beta-3 [Dreissena polymorpha]KAH3824068.1 hypothetical protein DPMN_125896 [Dreissena polymorpha]
MHFLQNRTFGIALMLSLPLLYTCLRVEIPQSFDSSNDMPVQLSFRPKPDVRTTLIHFKKESNFTYTPYVDDVDGLLQHYVNEIPTLNESTVDCSSVTGYRNQNEWDTPCYFDIFRELGDNCLKQQLYGYEDGQPCILLKMKEIFDWLPEPFDNGTLPDDLKYENGNSLSLWQKYFVTVKCEGENPADKDNVGDIFYHPSNGFHFKYFPYRNQEMYRSPLVFVRFDNPMPAQLFMITCKIYAKNIEYNVLNKSGFVHFELLVD